MTCSGFGVRGRAMGSLRNAGEKAERAAARVAFYSAGILDDLLPYRYHEWRRAALFAQLGSGPLDGDVVARVKHYNKLELGAELDGAGRIDQVSMARSYYYYDFKRYAKAFGRERRLAYLFGDVIDVPDRPSVVKSRPIGDDNANSVVMKLDRLRHFRWPVDRRPFREKAPTAVWRGGAITPVRRALVRLYASHPRFDIGHTGGPFEGIAPKRYLSIPQQREHRYLVSIEGVDVATNLKWIMASNSLCLMRRPRYETWFMEGRLRAGEHYVELRDDLEDLEEKVAYYEANPDEAEAIIHRAHAHIAQFLAPEREDLISLLVLHKYFVATGQCAPEAFTHDLFTAPSEEAVPEGGPLHGVG